MDQRRDHLAQWAVGQIQQLTGQSLHNELSVVSGDASFRRYFRLHGQQQNWICVDAPPDKEDNPRFIRIARQWAEQCIRVPAVIAEDIELGFMLLEDFGDQLLWPALHEGASSEQVVNLYKKAIDELIRIQAMPTGSLSGYPSYPAYDETLLRQEMALFPDWLCGGQLGMTLTDADNAVLSDVAQKLVASAMVQPSVVVHRDYHSRNLMLCADEGIGVIDFQDAVSGPLTYDLVSLLRDCYVRWPQQIVDELCQYYFDKAVNAGLLESEYQDFVIAFDLMGMQRHLKAAGIFARLNIRDGKPGYLADIPNTCLYLREVAGRHPQFSTFADWLDQRFFPVLEQGL